MAWPFSVHFLDGRAAGYPGRPHSQGAHANSASCLRSCDAKNCHYLFIGVRTLVVRQSALGAMKRRGVAEKHPRDRQTSVQDRNFKPFLAGGSWYAERSQCFMHSILAMACAPKNRPDHQIIRLAFLDLQRTLTRIFATPDFDQAWKHIVRSRHYIQMVAL